MMGCYKTIWKRCQIALVMLLMVLWGHTLAFAQAVPAFDLEAVTMGGSHPGESRLDIYTKIPYSRLQFISRSNAFLAEYEVRAEVFRVDEKGRQQGVAVSRIWERKVPPVKSYTVTQSDTLYDVATYSETSLSPGRYILEIQIEDKVASTTFVQKMPIEVRDLSQIVALSDLLVADTYDVRKRNLKPNVCNTIGNDETSFALFYEIHAKRPIKVQTSYVFYQLKGRSKASIRSLFRWGRSASEDKVGDITYERADQLSLKAGKNLATLNVPVSNLEVGDYVIRVQVKDGNGRLLDSVDKTITIRWMGLSDQIQNLDEAIAQLEYVAKSKHIKFIKGASTAKDKAQRFYAFWKRRDPTPGTIRNEYMEEYYYRISFANKKYGNFSRGWQTDRGLVFIKFGEPDHIQPYPYGFGRNKPYEVWRYDSIGRRFIFVDNTGVGDYELLIPIWDDRTRLR